MEKKKEDFRSRREFFKKAAKSVLPLLAAVAFVGNPIIVKAIEKSPMGCTGTCTGYCDGGCKGCSTTCSGTCSGGCTGCSTTCSGTCSGGCSRSCYTSNR